MRTEFRWSRPIASIIEQALGSGAPLFAANECKRLMDPYVPANNLVLAQNVRVYQEGIKGIVEYLSPYAHYQYAGELYVDPVTGKGGFFIEGIGWRSRSGVAKVPSGRGLSYSTYRHPIATSHWDKAMLVAKKKHLIRAIQNYVRSGR